MEFWLGMFFKKCRLAAKKEAGIWLGGLSGLQSKPSRVTMVVLLFI